MVETNRYIAVIGDLVGSRLFQDRQGVQEKLRSLLHTINDEYQDDLASRFSLTLGDEFQGVLKRPDRLLKLLVRIKLHLWPITVRFGVGIGEITTTIDPAASIGADGPAYHAARAMITEVKRAQTGKKALRLDTAIGQAGAEPFHALNAGLCLLHFVETDWTTRQREHIGDSLLGGLNQSEIALRRGVNQSTIQRSLDSAGYYEYAMALARFQQELDNRWRDDR